MLNLLRSDFYRLFKTKSFYICAAIEVALFILNALILNWAATLTSEDRAVYQSMLPDGGLDFASSVFSGNIQLLIGIIIAIFVTAEFSHGTMKNSVSKGFLRWKIYASKGISMLAAAYLLIFVTFIIGAGVGAVLFGGMGVFTADLFKKIGIELLLYAALVSFFLLISMVIRNLGGVLAINILGVLTVEPLIYQIIELINKGKIEFSKYSLVNNIDFYNSSAAGGDDYLRSAVVALVYLAITLILGLLAFRKADIK
jgi:ABC-2 type transport system permease protein